MYTIFTTKIIKIGWNVYELSPPEISGGSRSSSRRRQLLENDLSDLDDFSVKLAHIYAVYLHTKNHRIPINRLGVTAVESLADLRSSSVMKNDGRRRNTASHLTIMIKTACEHILSVHGCKRLALELVPAKLGFCPTVQLAWCHLESIYTQMDTS